MTEWTDHNGGGGDAAEPAVADAPRRRRARNAATPDPDTGDENYRGQWQARNDDGKTTVTTSEIQALRFACPPDRVRKFKHGDVIEV